LVARTKKKTIGCASVSTLRISGGNASSGNSLIAPETRSRTSLAAASTSRPGRNSTVISERPSVDREAIVSIPSTPASRSSSGCVMRFSITWALAPV
jgi:hypothetical protein